MSFIEIDESSREILNLALGFLESQEMKDYLKNYDFSKSLAPITLHDCCATIVRARSPLAEKAAALRKAAELLEAGAADYSESCDYSEPASLAGAAEAAIEETKVTAPGTVFLLYEKSLSHDGSYDNWDTGLFFSFDAAMQKLRDTSSCYKENYPTGTDINNDTWFTISKWEPDEGDTLRKKIEWLLSGCGDIWFFEAEKPENDDDKMRQLLYENTDNFQPYGVEAYLPMPYKPGDIVTFDGRPMKEIFHCVILSNPDYRDCCSVQCLFIDKFGKLKQAALKHGSTFGSFIFSFVQRAEFFAGTLPKREKRLREISRVLSENAEHVQALMLAWNCFYIIMDIEKMNADDWENTLKAHPLEDLRPIVEWSHKRRNGEKIAPPFDFDFAEGLERALELMSPKRRKK